MPPERSRNATGPVSYRQDFRRLTRRAGCLRDPGRPCAGAVRESCVNNQIGGTRRSTPRKTASRSRPGRTNRRQGRCPGRRAKATGEFANLAQGIPCCSFYVRGLRPLAAAPLHPLERPVAERRDVKCHRALDSEVPPYRQNRPAIGPLYRLPSECNSLSPVVAILLV